MDGMGREEEILSVSRLNVLEFQPALVSHQSLNDDIGKDDEEDQD